jgi:hypothetical protein
VTPPPLLLGVVVLGALVGAFALGAWWLFLSPIGTDKMVPRPRSDPASARLAAGAILVYFLTGSAGIWDTAWHMRFGLLGTVVDFWWPPHVAIYGLFGLTAFVACLALGGSSTARAGYEHASGPSRSWPLSASPSPTRCSPARATRSGTRSTART